MARQILHEETLQSRLVRTAIYARVSTANNGQDPKMQTRELLEYCERRGWKFAGEYVDEGISGSKDNRPELNRLMADAHHRRFDAVVVWRFDRFARSVSHKCEAQIADEVVQNIDLAYHLSFGGYRQPFT
jgi:DNA invertase Pin-like site-specific DNA recombinase